VPALVVGLGNPGPEYAGTRHNLGFDVVEIIAARLDVRLRPAKGIPAIVAEARDGDRQIILAQPTTFMNLSGEAVGSCMRYYRCALQDVVVVHDDVDLAFMDLRVKRGGGDGGHNGLKHITRALRSADYARIRLGIGRPEGRKDVADFVLGRFAKAEQADAAVLVERGADATLGVVRDGVDATHKALHGETPRTKPRRVEAKRRIDAAQDVVAAALAVPPGATVTDADLPRRIAFDVATTPEPTRAHVRLKRSGENTIVEVTHSGWGEGPAWEAARADAATFWETWLTDLAARSTP
jgi:peptidyl-tRNA hydrolase, PTH1 family